MNFPRMGHACHGATRQGLTRRGPAGMDWRGELGLAREARQGNAGADGHGKVRRRWQATAGDARQDWRCAVRNDPARRGNAKHDEDRQEWRGAVRPERHGAAGVVRHVGARSG